MYNYEISEMFEKNKLPFYAEIHYNQRSAVLGDGSEGPEILPEQGENGNYD